MQELNNQILPSSGIGSLAPLGLPEKVEFCKKCVISNQRPITKVETTHVRSDVKQTTRFTDGVCDACRWAEMKEKIDWEMREKELWELCSKHRSNSSAYDVIVPASGGKDSRYVAHILKHKYGMNPLTVTWKPHLYTSVGFQNLISMIDNGFDNILYSPNGKVQRLLCKLAFLNLGYPMQPFVIGQRCVGPNTALKYGVKLVFYGENVAEYGNRIEDNYIPTMDPSLYTCFNFKEDNLSDFTIAGLNLKDLVDSYGLTYADLLPYKSPSASEIQDASVEVHYMSYYRKWVPQDNYYYAVEHTDFYPNPKRRDGSFSRYAGLDDMMEDLHYFMSVVKFGMGRCTWDAAQEVRSGRLERDEAVALVNKYDAEPPTEYMDELLDYLSLTSQEFWDAVDKFRSPNLWSFLDGEWKLKHPVA